jgi:2',3'-cyclic-nucleotide 2'-phosphodiesterase/3'-nucleotidase
MKFRKNHACIRVLLCIAFLIFAVTLCAKQIEIISFNDFHGSLLEETSGKGLNPGMAKLVAFIKELEKKKDGRTIIVSAGDNFQGSALSALTDGRPVIEIMNELGVSASAVGNHEFDWGNDKFVIWNKLSKFPFLAANIINTKTNATPEWIKPYVIVEKDGKKIAFIGLTTQEIAYKAASKNLVNLKFTDPAETLQKWIDYLKSSADKPDAFIALTHIASLQDEADGKISNEELLEMCQKIKGLDGVISGHSHKRVAGFVNGIPVVQGGYNGRSVGILDMEFSDEDGKLVKITPSFLIVPKSDTVPDKEALEIIDKYQKGIKEYDKVLGVASDEILHDREAKGLTPLGVFAAKAMNEEFNTQLAMINAGGLRDTLHKGAITQSRMYEIFPFDNEIVTMKMNRADIKRVLESKLNSPDKAEGNVQFYGIKVQYDPSAPYKERIISMTLPDGQELKDNEYYSVATVDFMYSGGDRYDFSGAKDFKDTGILIRDVISEAIKKDKTVVPPKTDYLTEKKDAQETKELDEAA